MPQKFLSIKNFEKYQHFKKASPPWIKLYRSTLDDREFINLPTTSKYVYLGLLILASEGCNNVFNDPSWISHRLAIKVSELDLRPLYKAGFLIASESTVDRQTISQRRDREETETEEIPTVVGVSTKVIGKVQFPEGWKPEPEELEQWRQHGLTDPAVEFATFRDHARSNDRRCKDWPAAWRNWCRKALRIKEERANGLYQVRK